MPRNCWTCRHFDTPWADWWESRCCECNIRTPVYGDGVLWEPRAIVHEVSDAERFSGETFEDKSREPEL